MSQTRDVFFLNATMKSSSSLNNTWSNTLMQQNRIYVKQIEFAFEDFKINLEGLVSRC
jgi:hypothetical protein